MVIVTDFLTGVLTAVVLYAALYRFFDRPPTAREEQTLATVGDEVERDGRADGRQKPQEVVTR
jgi:hypothetical protein